MLGNRTRADYSNTAFRHGSSYIANWLITAALMPTTNGDQLDFCESTMR
jgi:hypothetical protein